mmetsp:Transcript_21424/g.45043  ORF Transcript_21424/g.45043 Transcript_21424/m.45043 type:complete len:86 (+) Transcript_21424:1170-1427(+)
MAVHLYTTIFFQFSSHYNVSTRYQPNQKFTWHYDVLDPKSMDTLRDDGGQRIATLLVYLNEIYEENCGATLFRDLGPEEMVPLRV